MSEGAVDIPRAQSFPPDEGNHERDGSSNVMFGHFQINPTCIQSRCAHVGKCVTSLKFKNPNTSLTVVCKWRSWYATTP